MTSHIINYCHIYYIETTLYRKISLCLCTEMLTKHQSNSLHSPGMKSYLFLALSYSLTCTDAAWMQWEVKNTLKWTDQMLILNHSFILKLRHFRQWQWWTNTDVTSVGKSMWQELITSKTRKSQATERIWLSVSWAFLFSLCWYVIYTFPCKGGATSYKERKQGCNSTGMDIDT